MLAIDMLVDECEPTQVRHMLQLIEPQFQRDFISLLPKEVMFCILYFSDIIQKLSSLIILFKILVGLICFIILGSQRFVKSSPDMS